MGKEIKGDAALSSEEFIMYIKDSNFREAYRLFSKGYNGELHSPYGDALFLLGYDEENLGSYLFLEYALTIEESPNLYQLISYLLVQAYFYIPGAYYMGLHYARKAIRLDPENLDRLEWLLFFHGIPDNILETSEATEVAERVLAADPNRSSVKEFLCKISNQ